PGRRLTAVSTSAVSAICGTHFGETKLPDSTVLRPASASASINATLVASGTIVASFCSPSRGPTSTMRTDLGKLISARLLSVRFLSGRLPFDQAQFLHDLLAHDELLDLAGHGHREFLDEIDIARDLVMRDLALAEGAHAVRVQALARAQLDPDAE